MAERLKADRRLYTNADRSSILEEDHPDCAYLLYAAGRPIRQGDVERFGLSADEHGRVVYDGVTLPEPGKPDATELETRKAAIEARLGTLQAEGLRLLSELEEIDAELGVDADDDGEEGEEGDSDRNTLEELEASWEHDMDPADYYKRWPETEAGELAGKIVAARAARADEEAAGAS